MPWAESCWGSLTQSTWSANSTASRCWSPAGCFGSSCAEWPLESRCSTSRLLRTVALVAVDDAVLTAAEMLRRLALRHGALDAAQELLQGIALAPLEQATLGIAETIEPRGIATLDAIHLATAVRMSDTLDAVMTYDAALARGAEHHGLTVLAPA